MEEEAFLRRQQRRGGLVRPANPEQARSQINEAALESLPARPFRVSRACLPGGFGRKARFQGEGLNTPGQAAQPQRDSFRVGCRELLDGGHVVADGLPDGQQGRVVQ